jgi:hypothetical protein
VITRWLPEGAEVEIGGSGAFATSSTISRMALSSAMPRAMLVDKFA